MTTETRPVLDLLRERRRELGIEPLAATLSQRRTILQRGALIGLALAGAFAGLCAVVLLQHAVVKARMGSLQAVEAEAQQLDTLLAARQQKLASITATNTRLATALTSSRTSAALLAELQLLTPAEVQLTAAEVKDDNLTIKGRAFDPFALVRINALELQLRRSPMFEQAEVKLQRVEREKPLSPNPAAPQRTPAANPAEPGPLGFEIRAPFAPVTPGDQLTLLTRLGSEGMAQRLRLLRQEGLMP